MPPTPGPGVASAVLQATAMSAFASFRQLGLSKRKPLLSELEYPADIGWIIHKDEPATTIYAAQLHAQQAEAPTAGAGATLAAALHTASPPRKVLTPLSQNSPFRESIPPWAKKYEKYVGPASIANVGANIGGGCGANVGGGGGATPEPPPAGVQTPPGCDTRGRSFLSAGGDRSNLQATVL